MRPRTGLALLLVGAMVFAGGWYFGPAQQPGVAQAMATGKLMFPDLAAHLQDAAEVQVANQGKTLTIRKTGDTWGLAERDGYPVEAEKLRSMLTALTELRLVEPRTTDPADYARLGVNDPNAANSTADLLRVLNASGKPIAELIVGHRRVLTSGNVPDEVFVRRPNEAQSWLATGSLSVDADPQLWLVRNIMNIDHARVAHVAIERDGATLAFDGKDGKLAMTAPAEHPPLDDYKVSELASGLESLTCDDVRPGPAPTSGEIGQAVFTTTDGLAVTARLYQSGKDVLARFAVAGDGKAKAEAAKLDARVGKWTYQISNWKEAALVPTLADLEAKPEGKPTAGATQ
ncbi:MAG TPA: DUF4340 domain-containing protein [Acetobacteraceae bacterium]|nr:DUF4340 domain-containing protein [Acetobacteraceae bacterium]